MQEVNFYIDRTRSKVSRSIFHDKIARIK